MFKENPMPIKDLETSLKVSTKIVGSVFEELKPVLKMTARKGIANMLKKTGKI